MKKCVKQLHDCPAPSPPAGFKAVLAIFFSSFCHMERNQLDFLCSSGVPMNIIVVAPQCAFHRLSCMKETQMGWWIQQLNGHGALPEPSCVAMATKVDIACAELSRNRRREPLRGGNAERVEEKRINSSRKMNSHEG